MNLPADAGEKTIWDYLREGNAALAGGSSEEAYVAYVEAQTRGHNFAFSTINKCMACTLAKDLTGAQRLLDQMRVIPGTPMEINLRSLATIIAAMRAETVNEQLEILRAAVAAMPDFDYNISPLRYLEKGLIRRDGSVMEPVAEVFNLLKTALSEHLSVPHPISN